MGSLIRLGIAAVAALIAAGGLWYGVEQRGAKRAVAKIEARNAKAIANADTAGAASRNPKSRGLRDPYARND